MLVCVIESKLLHYLEKLKRYIVSSGILHVTIAASCVLANSIVFQMAINNWIELSAPGGPHVSPERKDFNNLHSRSTGES